MLSIINKTIQNPHIDSTFWRKLVAYSVPVGLQMVLFSILGLVDVMMVAHLGDEAVAAVGIGTRVFFMNLLVVFGVAGGLSVLASQYFGANQLEGIRRVVVQALVFSFAVSAPFMLFYMINPSWVIGLASQDANMIELAASYLWIITPSFLATIVVVPLEAALRSVGRPNPATYIGIVAIVINIVLNAVFIFGMDMGVDGSALGTTLSRFIQMVITVWFVVQYCPMLLPKRVDVVSAMNKQHWIKFLVLAAPLMLHDGFWAVGMFVYQIVFGRMGTDALAIMSLLGPVEAILVSGFFGIAVAASTMLGHELGAKNFERAKAQAWVFLAIGPLFALFLALLLMPFAEDIVYAINGFQPPMEGAATTLVIIVFGLVLKIVNMTGIMGVLRAGGDIKYSIFIDLFALWFVGLPIAFYCGLSLAWLLPSVVLAILLEEVVKMMLVIERTKRGIWVKSLV